MGIISDENLYNICKTYGGNARIWRQRFAGLLPEVFKRKLYEKKGFISIFEFAKKLAGMSEEQVRLVLNLEKRFERTPALKSLLIDGKVSINKLSRIVSIAKPENEIFLVNQVQMLSKSAVETLVRDEKFAEKNSENFGAITMDFEKQNGLWESFFGTKVLPEQMRFDTKNTKSNEAKNDTKMTSKTLNLSEEVEQELLELQQKGIDINTLLKEFLQKREEEIAQKKEEISREISEREMKKEQEKQAENPTRNPQINNVKIPITSPSRHTPISIKRILYAERGTKCSIKTCKKPSEQIHHIRRFSAIRSNDPRYLAPLCKEHHELAHSADIAYQEIRQKRMMIW